MELEHSAKNHATLHFQIALSFHLESRNADSKSTRFLLQKKQFALNSDWVPIVLLFWTKANNGCLQGRKSFCKKVKTNFSLSVLLGVLRDPKTNLSWAKVPKLDPFSFYCYTGCLYAQWNTKTFITRVYRIFNSNPFILDYVNFSHRIILVLFKNTQSAGKKCHFAVLCSKMVFFKKSDLRIVRLESFHFLRSSPHRVDIVVT